MTVLMFSLPSIYCVVWMPSGSSRSISFTVKGHQYPSGILTMGFQSQVAAGFEILAVTQ